MASPDRARVPMLGAFQKHRQERSHSVAHIGHQQVDCIETTPRARRGLLWRSAHDFSVGTGSVGFSLLPARRLPVVGPRGAWPPFDELYPIIPAPLTPGSTLHGPKRAINEIR